MSSHAEATQKQQVLTIAGHWQGEDQKPETQTENEGESIGGIGGNDDPESTAGHSGRARREVGGERGQKEAEHQQEGRSGRAGLESHALNRLLF